MNPTEDDYFRAVGYYKGTGLSEEQAHAAAESEMESRERIHDNESCVVWPVFIR